MKLEYAQLRPGCADGACRITAKGGILASLHWADQNGPLENWTQLALLPLLPTGTGSCTLTGNRAVPPQATHLLARVIAVDFSLLGQLSIPIPLATPPQEPPLYRLLVMTDLHLSRKPWQVRQGLTIARGYDALLITGDLTNDGLPYQMEAVFDAITELLPDIAVFAVAGNHDYPLLPSPRVIQGASDYPALQQSLLERAQKLGWHCIQHPSGAYLAARNQLRIIGLNATGHFRRFRFPEDGQLEWLSALLSRQQPKTLRPLLLCHAPLAAHQPYPGSQPYLHRNRILQQIVNDSAGVVFLSGHTHISLNCRPGCAEQDGQNLYLNAGSIRPGSLPADELLQPEEWTHGNVVELLLGRESITVSGITVGNGRRIARGFYRF